MTQDMISSPVANDQEAEDDSIAHPVLSRVAVAILPPILVCDYHSHLSTSYRLITGQSKSIDEKHALSWLRFEEDFIIAACRDGHIFTWDRPKDPSSLEDGLAP